MTTILCLGAVVFSVALAAVWLVRRRTEATSDNQLILRSGCIPAMLGLVGGMLGAFSLSGDPSAGLDLVVGLFAAPIYCIWFFVAGILGGIVGLKVASRP